MSKFLAFGGCAFGGLALFRFAACLAACFAQLCNKCLGSVFFDCTQ